MDSVAGNDFNLGTSPDVALQSLTKLDEGLYHPGDQILLKAGSVFTDTLNIATTNESTDTILVTSYGDGPAPILAGNFDHTPVTLEQAHHVTLDDLTMQNAKTLVSVRYGDGNTVQNCTLRNASVFGVYMGASDNFTVKNNTYSEDDGFTMHGDVVWINYQGHGVTITGNTITLNEASKSSAAIYVIDADDAIVSDNTIIGGSQAIGVKGYSKSVTGAKVFSNNILGIDGREGDGEGIEFTGVSQLGPWTVTGVIYWNTVTGGPYTVNAIAAYHAPSTRALYNKVHGPLKNSGFHWSSQSTGGTIHHNTISGAIPHAVVVLSGSSVNQYSNTISK